MGLSTGASLCAHAFAWGAGVFWPWFAVFDEGPRFGGQRTAIEIQAVWSTSEPVESATEISLVAPVEVSVREVVVEKQRWTAIATADATPPPLPETDLADVGEFAAAAESRRLTELLPDAEPPGKPVALKRQPAPMRAHDSQAVVALPQPIGVDPDEPPRFAGNRPPNYPLVAQQRRWQGTVLLRLWIDETGVVVNVEVERSSGYEVLDGEAATAVRAWRGEPAKRGGRNVATQELLPVHFRLP